MMRGFYNLTSAMLTQGRRLDVVSQNMVNSSTAGYKEDTYHHVAFEEYMLDRIGNNHETPATAEVGETYFKVVSSEITTNYDQGVLEETNLNLDFALEGDGFFAVQWDWEESPYNTPLAEGEEALYHAQVAGDNVYDEEGNRVYDTEQVISYTRSGQFSLDQDGNLFLPNFGYVLDQNYNQINLGTDQITADAQGNIYHKDTGELLGTLGIFQFEDNTQLQRDPRGTFITDEVPVAAEDVIVHHKYIERSNTTLLDQMSLMITTQRALQSAASVTKIYDDMMTKITTELGRA